MAHTSIPEWYNNRHCMDCKIDTMQDTDGKNINYYMFKRDLWIQINPKHEGMLCINCAEKRLGRKLVLEDFSVVESNKNNDLYMSLLNGENINKNSF